MVPKYTGALRRLERSTRRFETDSLSSAHWVALGQQRVVLESVGLHEGLGAKLFYDLRFNGNEGRRMEALRTLKAGLEYCASQERVWQEETLVDRIVNEGAEDCSKNERIAMVDAVAGVDLVPLLQNLHRTREDYELMLATIRRMLAIGVCISVYEVDWVIQVALEVVDWTIQYDGWLSGFKVCKEVVSVLSSNLKEEMLRRLKAEEFFRMESLLAVYTPSNHNAPGEYAVLQLVTALEGGESAPLLEDE